MIPFADAILLAWLVTHAAVPATPAADVDAPLRTFTIQKSPDKRQIDTDTSTQLSRSDALLPPRSTSRIAGLVGLGYVQHADWGAEVMAGGPIAGMDLQLDGLVTYGSQGARLDHGTLTLADPTRGWRAEAGDLFSNLRGPVRGASLTWAIGDRWQPGLSLDGPAPSSIDRRTLLVYHDRVRFGPVSFDGELAQDTSYFLRSRVAAGRFDVEASYRRGREPVPLRDGGVQVGVRVWKGVSVTAGAFRSDRPGDRNEWRTVAVHLPIYKYFGLTLERAFTTTNRSTNVMSGVMVDVHAGSLLFYQRYQIGHADYATPGLGTFSREQLQSMASYPVGPRLNLTLQVASQWVAAGRAQNWLELQTDVRLARRTTLQVATPLPGAFEAERVRVRLDQGLPGRFSVFAEYGRPSAYQPIEDGLEQPRFKLMLRRSWDVATPSRGGEVSGLVLDYVGRPVPGARVRLGPYSTDADAGGAYVFTHVPRGEFELSLDPNFLPADYAWDGRARHLEVAPSSRLINDLVVAPLGAIHGRVFADRNGNGRFDPGEGVANAVLALGDRVTATDRDGAYDFYNLVPGPYVVRLDAARLPAAFEAPASVSLAVDLRDDRPVTGADFLVRAKVKPVIWRDIKDAGK